MALQGLFLHLEELKAAGKLFPLSDTSLAAVVICPDGPYPYLDEYFKYCDAKLFPEVLHPELLLDPSFASSESFASWDLEPQTAFEHLYLQTVE